MKRYFENSIENMRDIGGYSINGKKIPYGKIIRSNLPDKMTKADLDSLEKMKIDSIIDLRTKEEIQKQESSFQNNSCFHVFNYEVKGKGTVPKSQEEVPISYMEMLEGKDTMYRIFKLLAEQDDKGILYFCTAGKDRTGVVTALILMTLGASRKDIIDDYVLSNKYLDTFLKQVDENSSNQKVLDIITPKTEYMEQFLNYFDEKYHSIDNYLNEIGITKEDIQTIQNKYLK